ncbi:hypothetical protein [Leifsonia sp. NPDC058230]|uniref:hypothetical protein n=1 Tax=Leifsonia sp. NPDC058230 TaxID=3346391 RepID=UPI0036D8CC96
MTLWQDPPPQTRRQARENERSAEQKAAGQASRRAGTAEPTPAGEIPIVTTPFTFSAGRQDDAQDSSAKDKSAAPRSDEQPAIPATAFAEPGVSAPSRPNLPTYGSSFDSLLAPDASNEAVDDSPAADLYRQSPAPGSVEPVTKPVSVVPQPPRAASTPAPVTPAPGASGERILTRRELRAMQQAQEANQQAGHIESVVPITFTAPGDETDPAADARSTESGTAEAPADIDSAAATAWPFAPLTPSAAVPAVAPSYTPPVFTPDDDASTNATPSAGTAPSAAVPPVVAPEAEAVDATASETSDGERAPYQPPVGHWSTAAELDDKNQPFDQIISRNVGTSGSATTTNALILPSLPVGDATGPLTSTGEILVTGSIDLPRGLGSTGAHDRIDSSDIDRLLDGEENEFNTSEVAPVRASRAISSHTSTRGVITPPKKRGTRLPVILSITAAVLAVGVIGLLVAAYVLNVF